MSFGVLEFEIRSGWDIHWYRTGTGMAWNDSLRMSSRLGGCYGALRFLLDVGAMLCHLLQGLVRVVALTSWRIFETALGEILIRFRHAKQIWNDKNSWSVVNRKTVLR